ncbi:MAG: ribonuclease P protein component [Armatimonadetes bacterium]|nr:ribonuclease P protein component [Armatimonadota bacterium]
MQTLRNSHEFRKVYAEGRRYSVDLFVLYRRAAYGPPRVGLVVRKGLGTAVARNRLRRRLREILRHRSLGANQEIVVVARGEAARAPWRIVTDQVDNLLIASCALEAS